MIKIDFETKACIQIIATKEQRQLAISVVSLHDCRNYPMAEVLILFGDGAKHDLDCLQIDPGTRLHLDQCCPIWLLGITSFVDYLASAALKSSFVVVGFVWALGSATI